MSVAQIQRTAHILGTNCSLKRRCIPKKGSLQVRVLHFRLNVFHVSSCMQSMQAVSAFAQGCAHFCCHYLVCAFVGAQSCRHLNIEQRGAASASLVKAYLRRTAGCSAGGQTGC